jgi:hypothetical protein
MKKMSDAIKNKLGGFSSKDGKGNFSMLYVFILMFGIGFLAYMFYHYFLQKKKIS